MSANRWRTVVGAGAFVALIGAGLAFGAPPSGGTPSVTAGATGSAASLQAASSATCPNPSFVTSAPFGGQSFGNYFLYNNEWNAAGHAGSQTLYACNFNNWYVTANWTDNGSHAVLTYPNVQANFSSVPISS